MKEPLNLDELRTFPVEDLPSSSLLRSELLRKRHGIRRRKLSWRDVKWIRGVALQHPEWETKTLLDLVMKVYRHVHRTTIAQVITNVTWVDLNYTPIVRQPVPQSHYDLMRRRRARRLTRGEVKKIRRFANEHPLLDLESLINHLKICHSKVERGALLRAVAGKTWKDPNYTPVEGRSHISQEHLEKLWASRRAS